MYDWERESWAQNYFDTMDIVEIEGRGARRKQLDAEQHDLCDPPQMTTRALEVCTRMHNSRSGPDYRWSMPHVVLSRAGADAFV